MPAYAHRLIKASDFSSVFKLYFVLVWGVLRYLPMFSGFNLPNQYDSIKYLTMDKRKKTKKTTTKNRVSPSEQERLKHILVAVDAFQYLLDMHGNSIVSKTFFHHSTSQDKKLLLMLPFKDSQWRHRTVVSDVCISVFATASD